MPEAPPKATTAKKNLALAIEHQDIVDSAGIRRNSIELCPGWTAQHLSYIKNAYPEAKGYKVNVLGNGTVETVISQDDWEKIQAGTRQLHRERVRAKQPLQTTRGPGEVEVKEDINNPTYQRYQG